MTTTTHTSEALELPPADDAEEISRADLVFYGVDHSGPSYVGRVFLNNESADADTPQDAKHGYAGYFTVFGHNRCYGDEGHCLPERQFRDEFDQRPPHPLEPITKTVIATDAIRDAIADPAVSAATVTVVAIVPDDELTQDAGEPLKYDYVRLVTYEG